MDVNKDVWELQNIIFSFWETGDINSPPFLFVVKILQFLKIPINLEKVPKKSFLPTGSKRKRERERKNFYLMFMKW